MDMARPGPWPHSASRPAVRVDQFGRAAHQLADARFSASNRDGLSGCQPDRSRHCRSLQLQPESRAHLAPVIETWRSALVGTARLFVSGTTTGLTYAAGREIADDGRHACDPGAPVPFGRLA